MSDSAITDLTGHELLAYQLRPTDDSRSNPRSRSSVRYRSSEGGVTTPLASPTRVDWATELISNAMAAYYRHDVDRAALEQVRRTIDSAGQRPEESAMTLTPSVQDVTERTDAALYHTTIHALCSLRGYQLAVNRITDWVSQRLWRRDRVASLRLMDRSLDLDDFSVPPAPWLHRVFRVAGTLNHTGTPRGLLFRVNDLLYEWLPAYGRARGLPLDGRAAPEICDYYGKAFLRPPLDKPARRDTAGRGGRYHPRRARREVHHG